MSAPLVNVAPVPDAPFESLETATAARPHVEVRRSARRRRTLSAHREGDRIVVAVPARMTRAEEARMVDALVARVLAKEAGSTPSDADLAERATRLSSTYLGGRAVPASIRWVDTMNSRWGSCTPLDRSIRLSRRLCGMPEYVVDYVLLHELAHLLVPGHGAAFWAELAGFERLERARGYLEGFDAANQ
jgi:predicted metal-dependent hydrolase